ncbi:alpha/beta hydrolase [Clostridium sediminicola]|uniref:dienelactone hydrolase family protein n=1 Tax=Clostridium sediminicola TaxID=3114879 RepID=UPI0031F1CB95
MKINFDYNKKRINYIDGYIFKGKFYRCGYTRFPTAYGNPALGCENVQLYDFRPKEETRASVIIIPGLGSRNIKFLLWMGTHLASVGVNSTVIILPGNYTRVEHNSVSGKSFLWPDMEIMFQFWENAVVDVCSTIDYLEQRGTWKKNNCIVGYCLGGMITSIVAALDKRVNQAIFMTTGGHMPKIIHKSSSTKFIRELFKNGYKSKYYLEDKKRLYDIYSKQISIVRQMSFMQITKSQFIHPLFKIDPLAYAHLLQKDKVTVIDALLDETIPLTSRISLYSEMKGAKRYIIPATHVSWLPFERFLAQYILFKVNINDKKANKLVIKKQKFRF